MIVLTVVLLVAAAMIAVEVARPARPWPRVAGWWSRALLLNGVQALTSLAAARLWDAWLADHRPWSIDTLPIWLQASVGYLGITFVYYWWHRARHEVPLLWRWVHQVHHSPRRIEVVTSFYKHPVEIAVNSLLSSAILYLGVGVSPAGAASAVLLTGLAELFYHWNVTTPYALGFFFQRPESHCLHHQEGLHRYNYADLPLWDMLFGTFRNPRRWHPDAGDRCGFGEDEGRLGDMLRGIDVLEARPAGDPSRGDP